ncbi:MAG: biotin--[acetyl-CoA-carboxylase] ligase [Caldicoprobacterales bacterium]
MKDQILMILMQNRERFFSGEEISRLLGVSRTAVWKAVRQLRDDGFEVESVTSRGYRLGRTPDILNPALLQSFLKTKKLGRKTEFHDSIDSTNTRAKELAQEGAAHGTLVAAEEQRKGRGRLGRSWDSPPGMGIWMSVILRPAFPPRFAPRMTALAGLAVLDAVNMLTGSRALIKWPNDIIINRKKVCGILTEMQADPDLIEYVIIGIGMNVNTPKEGFPEELAHSATSLLLETGQEVNRCQMTACILNSFEKLYDCYEKTTDFSGMMERYRSQCITLGKRVRVVSLSGEWEGTALDLTEDCELVVELEDGSRCTVLSGDVSVRGIAGYL